MAYDEWNVWYRTDDGRLEERYNLADALAVATYLNVFVRQCAVVRMANLAQLVNVIAPIVTSPDGAVPARASIHPFRLMATASQEVAVTPSSTQVRMPTPTGRGALGLPGGGSRPVPAAGRGGDPGRGGRRLTISVVNRDPERPSWPRGSAWAVPRPAGP